MYSFIKNVESFYNYVNLTTIEIIIIKKEKRKDKHVRALNKTGIFRESI